MASDLESLEGIVKTFKGFGGLSGHLKIRSERYNLDDLKQNSKRGGVRGGQRESESRIKNEAHKLIEEAKSLLEESKPFKELIFNE